MHLRRPIAAMLLSVASFVSACDTAAERADRYYQSGLELLKQGDVDRALVEFRNVFKLDGQHREARIAYAEAERKRGNFREAYSQYLRLIEQYPRDLVGLTALAEMASDNGQWADAKQFIGTALDVAPTDVHLRAIKIFSDYGAAVESSDTTTIIASVKEARELRKEAPDNVLAYKVVIDDLIRAQSLEEALTELDQAIKIAPTERVFYAQRLSVFAARGEDQKVEAGLVEMAKVFPDAPEMKEALLRWYISRKETDKAEALLRSQIDPASDKPDAMIALIRFISQYRGVEAAITELDKAIAGGKSVAIFRSARAGFLFDEGKREDAIAEMSALLKSDLTPEDARNIRVGLARMQLAVGNTDASRQLVDEVLSEDSGQIEAVKLKANWLILGDQVGDAISLLRDAIDQNPRDASLMTLMAQAYERDGNRDLMRDMLSQAVEASGSAPEESLRYAQFLVSDDKALAAEGVLLDALRLAPGTPSLLVPLGQIYIQLKDWPRADSVAAELEGLSDASLTNDIASLRASILAGEQKSDQALSYLQQLAEGDNASLDAKVAVLRNHLNNNRLADAMAYADKMLQDDPENTDVKYIHASVKSAAGDVASAEAEYRAIVKDDPGSEQVWMALFRLVYAAPERRDEALALLDEALINVPDSGQLRWAKAGILESSGDIDGAIAIYDKLYQENSANPIVANNLASLLSNYRTDPDSLKRAEVIARRLKGSNLPPYQDTYGWIAYQNGKFDEAVSELEKAAVGMADDPTVQYHLAMAYLGAARQADAAKKFKDALALIPADDSRPFAISARSELDKLKAAGIAE